MKVSGFTFIRNAIKYDYPIREAINSILPLCDEVVVAVGDSEDGTRELIAAIDPEKVKIIDTEWDEDLRKGGRVLALETDKAFQKINPDADWGIYIQGDEVLHEKYIPNVRQSMEKWLDTPDVEALLFDYVHFYGSYDYVGSSNRWYQKEIRVVRNDKSIFSYKDAQGFRMVPNRKLRVKKIPASIYHYGWVKEPKAMQGKQRSFHRLWHDDEWMKRNIPAQEAFNYEGIDALEKFADSHPAVMMERISRKNWNFNHDLSLNRYGPKEKFKRWIKKNLGFGLGEYRNYIELK
jgi:hypothetical protein